MYLPTLRDWSPFRIDALGIVTLLGVDELDLALGRLVGNRYTDYLPLLGGFIVAQDRIVKPLPGFVVYNITDGIMATDVAGWFSRWLTCNLTWSSTTLDISSPQSSSKGTFKQTGTVLSAMMALLPTMGIAVVAAVMEDWWGFANAISMLVSVTVRRIVVGENRKAVDVAANKAVSSSDIKVKTYWSTPDGYTVTIHIPRTVLLSCFLTNPRPPNQILYDIIKMSGWVAFGCHVITLGMSTLFVQILSVVLLLIASVLVATRIGDDEERIGSSLNIVQTIRGEQRAAAYGRLEMTEKEEDSMIAWGMMPHRSNEYWWKNFKECKAIDSDTGFDNWKERMERMNDAAPIVEHPSVIGESTSIVETV